jgi:hypothetical protein
MNNFNYLTHLNEILLVNNIFIIIDLALIIMNLKKTGVSHKIRLERERTHYVD